MTEVVPAEWIHRSPSPMIASADLSLSIYSTGPPVESTGSNGREPSIRNSACSCSFRAAVRPTVPSPGIEPGMSRRSARGTTRTRARERVASGLRDGQVSKGMGKLTLKIDDLSAEERLDLLERLWDSLSERPDDVPLTAAHREELDRRLEELERDGPCGIPWDEVVRQIRERGP